MLLLWTAQSDAASFQWISESKAYDLSADGLVVVGLTGGIEAFRWTESTGLQGLGYLPEDSDWSRAWGVSSDGSVVVGDVGHDFPPVSGREAFRWTESGGMIGLGWLSTQPVHVSRGNDVSADGAVVVGTSMNASGKYEAFRWTQSDGMVGLDNLTGGTAESWSCAVSSDGLTVVGFIGSNAFRWTQSEGMVEIGGDTAYDVSDDGSVVVGDYGRWTEATGWQDIGFHAQAVSADGSVIVGQDSIWADSEAFIWDARYGTQNLNDWLESFYGLSLSGWTLTTAKGISADGLTIVGCGTNPNGQTEAWIARLGNKPGYLTGDSTGDGNTNLKDFAKLAYYWLQDEFFVDIAPLPNGDGVVDSQELAVLAEHWLENFYEDFETGDFSKYYWRHEQLSEGDRNWTVVPDVAHEGTYIARSDNTCDCEDSMLEIILDTECNYLSFYCKVSGDEYWDYLNFYIDGIRKGNWKGEKDWALETYMITPGEHTFTWAYKNRSGCFGDPVSGSNCAWIDNVRLYSVE
jgi:probable HAF family extracellular repeat protein